MSFRVLIDARAEKELVKLAKLIVQKLANLRTLVDDDGQEVQEAAQVAIPTIGWRDFRLIHASPD